MMSELDPAGIHNVKPNPGAIVHLGNGQQVYVIEEYERACDLWEEADRLVEFTTYSDFRHTDERVTYRLKIPMALIMRIDEFSEAINEAIDRDRIKHEQECQPKPAEPGGALLGGGGMILPIADGFSMTVGPGGIQLVEDEGGSDPSADSEEEEGGDDDGER